MSGAMHYIRDDPGTDSFLRAMDAGNKLRKVREDISVDTALRDGIRQATGGQQPSLMSPQAPQPPTEPAPAAGGAQPAAQPATGTAAPQAAPAPPAQSSQPASAFGGRYAPIMSSLADTPGGGAPALKLLETQGRLEAQQGALAGRRQDQYARLAMQAYSRGNNGVGDYYWQSAYPGKPKPSGMLTNPPRGGGGGSGDLKKFSAASLVAHRLYGDNPGAAQAFVAAFMRDGDANKAIQAAGAVPGGNIVGTHSLYDPTTRTYRIVGRRKDGTTVPLTDDDNTPLTSAPLPQNRLVTTDKGYGTVNLRDPSGGVTALTDGDGGQVQPAPKPVAPGAGMQVVQTDKGPVIVNKADPSKPAQPIMMPGGQPAAPPARAGGVQLRAVQGPNGLVWVDAKAPDAPAKPVLDANSQPIGVRDPAAIRTMNERKDRLVASGMSPQDADAFVAGKRGSNLTPSFVLNYRQRLRSSIDKSLDPSVIGLSPQGKNDLVDGMMERDIPGWRGISTGGQRPIMAPGPASAAPPPPPPAQQRVVPGETPRPAQQGLQRPPSVPQGSAFSASRQQWRDPAGNLYDAAGNPVR